MPNRLDSNNFQRLIGLAAIAAAGATIALAMFAADDAVAGPPDDQALGEPDVSPEAAALLGASEIAEHGVTRLSIPVPEGMVVDGGGPPPEPTLNPEYIYVNMDGVNITCNGNDDAVANSSWIACQYGFSGAYPAYGGTDAQRQSVMDATRQDWAPFDMVVTDQRPAAGPYTMCMTGPANHPFGNGVLGIAPLDCNNQMPSNVVFAFHSASQLNQFGANVQATTISQEVAHAYGLEHVASSADIMNPYNQGGNPSFTDTCIGLVSGNGQPIQCNSQHSQYCAGGQQNSYQELLGMFGAANPDDEPPNVVVAYPYDGDVFDIGANFTISCAASDNESVASVELWIDGTQQGGLKTAEPYEWPVNNIPGGTYEIYCVANDDFGNTAMSPVVTILVEAGGGDSGGGSGGDSGGGSGGDSGGDPGLPESGGLPPGFGVDDETGCACAAPGPREPGWLLLALLGLPLLSRRRDAA